MTESSDKDSKKVHLIKQTKPTPEQPKEQATQVSPDQGGEKKKVVVIVKKKVVTAKKIQAKAVEGGTPEGQKDEIKPVVPQSVPMETQVDSSVETRQTNAPVSQLKPERQAESPPVAHSKPGAEQGGSSGTVVGHQAHSVTPPPRPSTSSAMTHGSSTASRPNTSFGSQRRYSSDGRAGNLAQGRPGQRYDRGDPRSSPGAIAGRAYGTQTGRDYSSGQGRPGSTSPSQYNRGPHPVGGSQYPGSGGAVGKTGYSPGRPGQPVGSRPGGQGGSRVGVGGGYGSRQTPVPAPESGKTSSRRVTTKKKGTFGKREEELELEKQIQLKKKAEAKLAAVPKSIDIMENISISELAKKMNLKPADLISKLMSLGVMATINQRIDADTAAILAAEYGCEVKVVSLYDETVIEKSTDRPEELKPRPPIVTVMGHCRPRQDQAPRRNPKDRRRVPGIRRHNTTYRRIYGGYASREDIFSGHAGPRGLHQDACTGCQHY